MVVRILSLVYVIVTVAWVGAAYVDVGSHCCSYIGNTTTMMSCVLNATVHSTGDSDLVFATTVSPEVYSYAANNMLVNMEFMFAQNYRLHILSDSTGDDHFPSDRRWNKINAIRTALTNPTWAKDKQYIIMIDADLVILDRNFNIRSILDEYPDAELILAQDSIDTANTGFMIVRHSPSSVAFFQKWWESKGMHNTFCDQHVLNKLIAELHDTPDRNKIKVIAYHRINSKFPAIENFEESHPVLHLMGETNEVRNVVSQYLAQQTCSRLEKRHGDTCHKEGAATDRVSATCVDHNKPVATRAILRELKHRSMVLQWEQHEAQCVSSNATDRDFELLHESIGHMCAPSKRINSTQTFVGECVAMMQVAYGINVQALQALHGTAENQHNMASRRLLHHNQISMLLFDIFELTGATTAAVYNIEAAKKKYEAAQKVLDSLDTIIGVLDMDVALNRAYIHHKRGIVFGSLSQYHQQYQQWTSSVEKEFIAVSEFSSALELTPHTEPEFPGFVLAYVHSASRVAQAYRKLQRLSEAREWAHIALNNIKILYSSTNNEERLMRAELMNIYSLCASVAADSKDWSLHSLYMEEIEALQRA